MWFEYFKSCEDRLKRIHPQWDYTISEIRESAEPLKRDGGAVCIPPSWDYFQTLDNPKNKQNVAGDKGKIEFLESMQSLRFGGILFGSIRSYRELPSKELIEQFNNDSG